MNTKRKRKKNRIAPMACALGIFIGSICNSYMNAYAEALPNFPPGVDLVSAADCMMSYFTAAGVYISNQDWINELYTSFGGGAGFYIQDLYQNGLLSLDDAGHYVSTGLDTALQNQSAWTSLHLDELFNVSAQEAAAGGGVAATGAGTIAGAMGGVATTGLLPLAFGVTGAYWGGIGLGTLANHLIDQYKDYIRTGQEITMNENAVNAVPDGGGLYYIYSLIGGKKTKQIYVVNQYVYGVCVINDLSGDLNNYSCRLFNTTNTSQSYLYFTNDNTDGVTRSITQNGNLNLSAGYHDHDGFFLVGDNTERDQYIQDVKNGLINPRDDKYSPDIITGDGNAKVTYSQSGGIEIPSIVPKINPNNESVKPGNVTETDYSRWARQANQNTTDDDPDDNADIFQEILEAIRNLAPSPGANPNPNPNPTPTPTPVPKPDYDPSQPEQPEYDPKETEGPSNVTDGDPFTTPDLLDKFPFCLPRDVFRCFEKLNVNERMAPSISWHFTTPLGINFDFDLNLDDYEGVAAILRTLELIAFIIGLALATRNLIGR